MGGITHIDLILDRMLIRIVYMPECFGVYSFYIDRDVAKSKNYFHLIGLLAITELKLGNDYVRKIYTDFLTYSLLSDDKKMIFEYANLILKHEDSIVSIVPLMAASILKKDDLLEKMLNERFDKRNFNEKKYRISYLNYFKALLTNENSEIKKSIEKVLEKNCVE